MARSDALIDALSADAPGCSAAAGQDGNVVWAKARGSADLAMGLPLTPATKFDIGSVSKQFTAAAILLLAADHRVALERPISAYLSGFPAWADSVSVADLIHHTSGIPEVMNLWFDRTPANDLPAAIDAIASVKELDFAPGTRWAYSNSNYVLLAEMVAVVSGSDLADFLDERIFRPLALDMKISPDRGGCPYGTCQAAAGTGAR